MYHEFKKVFILKNNSSFFDLLEDKLHYEYVNEYIYEYCLETCETGGEVADVILGFLGDCEDEDLIDNDELSELNELFSMVEFK